MMHLYLMHNESTWERFPWLYYQLERRLISKANKLFAVGEMIAQSYASAYPVLQERISFVPNGVNEDIFYPYSPKIKQEKKNAVVQKFEFSPKDNVLLFAGRLDGQKDPLLLIDAFACLHRRENNVKLIIAGTGRLEKKMRRKLEEHGLVGEVRFAGTQSQAEVAELMRTSDVFILTSATEGMPMVILESQACGLPVVSTDVGEAKKIIKEGSSGEVVQRRDPEVIAQKTLGVLMNGDRYSISNCCERTKRYRASGLLQKIYNAHYRL
jgi:glycosyltransferase involved in cell wall biosynthesis